LRPFLEDGFRGGATQFQNTKLWLPETPHHFLCGIIARIGEYGTEHRLARVADDTASRFAGVNTYEIVEFPGACNLRTRGRGHEVAVPARELTLARLWKAFSQELGYREAEHSIAKELETLIIVLRRLSGARARMDEGELEQFRI
jgi:hypothetical protein